ncbi:MAG: EAL domain-containing protein [Betaproteobacteria bacterium]|nr:EAL domain-containing protein [Betaproteobacteria bacterium]
MILTDADLSRYADSADACWVQDIHISRVVWANDTAVRVLRADSRETLYAREVKPLSKAAHTRLWTYLGRVSAGQEIETQWTTFSHGQPVTLMAKVRAFRTGQDRLALFFEARPIGDSMCAEGLRMLEASRHSMAFYSLYSLAGAVLENNASCLREFGDRSGTAGDHFLRLFADARDGERIRNEVITAGEFRGRALINAPRGKRWHLLLALSILDPVDGQRVIHAESIDIHEQVEAETRAVEAERLLQEIADEFPHPVVYIDRDRHYRFVNKTYCNWLGLARDRILGRTLVEVAGQEVEDIVDRSWAALVAGERVNYERSANYAGRGERWIRVDVVPHMTGQGNSLSGLFVLGYDIHAEKLAEAGRRSSERQLEIITDTLPMAVATFDEQDRVRFANRALCDWFGLRREAVIGRHAAEVFGNQVYDETYPVMQRARAGESVQVRRRSATNGLTRWVDASVTPFDDGDDNRKGVLAVYADVTKRVQANEALNRARNALTAHLANTPLAVLQLDANQRMSQWTGRASEVFGWEEKEAIGHSLDELRIFDEEGRERFAQECARLERSETDRFTASWRNTRRDGGVLHGEWYVSVLRDASQAVTSYLMLVQDVSARVQAERHLQYVANHDVLTGLANRSQFQERLKAEIARARRLNHSVAVVLVDLDRFKFVNESLGHSVGDALLQEVALRFADKLPAGDLLARTGGDEFMLLVGPGGNDKDSGQGLARAEALRKLLTRPFQVAGQSLYVTASIGVAVFPYDADSDTDLIKYADWAMYRAKDGGRNCVQVYSHALASDVPVRLSLESELRRATELDQLELHYQPKQNLVTQRITGAEALLRWRHPVRGLVPPDEFIPLAEESDLILQLGSWVIRKVTSQIALWRQQFGAVPQIAINLSAMQLKQRDLAKEILAALQEAGLPGSALMVEVTETGVVSDPLLATITLELLRDHGVHAAIDDFGKGFSSLTQLKRLPIDALKIDSSFVRDVVIDRDDAAIVQAIIGLARNLDLQVIAEGVETSGQMGFLVNHGCSEAQGYLISRPLPAEDFAHRFLAAPSG